MSDELITRGAHVMTVCNACRYCEQFCPVFPAMEERVAFTKENLAYLANLCHNCGECLYACQYAPPHEFSIDVPRTLAEIRIRTYEEHSWPRFLGAAFRCNNTGTSIALATVMTAVLAGAVIASGASLQTGDASGRFYAVMPHHVMVGIFGAVFTFVVVALAVGVNRFRRDLQGATGIAVAGDATAHGKPGAPPAPLRALRDVLTLRHLHGSGLDCTSAEESRRPWRRWLHHCTFYGFGLCFASTSVAAFYHVFLGLEAPYALTSLPVVLGVLGGVGLLIGPAGLVFVRRRRDPALSDPDQRGLDRSFIVLLFLTSLTGLALLALREQPIMGPLLVVHLGIVLALFLTLPYGKFVHGLYRTAALVKSAREGTS